jgi:hypothetical protein
MKKIFILLALFVIALSTNANPFTLRDSALLGRIASKKSSIISNPNGLLNGLIAYWTMDEGVGKDRVDKTGFWNLIDISTDGLSTSTGLINAAVDYTGATGNGCLVYPGSSPQSQNISSWTVSAWIYVPTGSGSVATLYQDGVCAFGSNIDIDSLYIYYFRSTDGGSSLDGSVSCLMEITDILPFDSWNHVCFTLNDGLVTLYLNGIDIAESSNVGGDWYDIGWPMELELGYSANNGTPYYVGTSFQQDETACWNVGLTAEQVLLLYNSGNGLPYTSFNH